MYIWQNKLLLPNYLHITECFFLNSFFLCHKSKEREGLKKPSRASQRRTENLNLKLSLNHEKPYVTFM